MSSRPARLGALSRTPARASAALALSALGVAAFAGPSASAQPRAHAMAGKTIDITWWESHQGKTNPVAITLLKLVDQFNASQADVHVDVTETSGSVKGLAAAQAGHPPVLAAISHYDGAFRHGGLIVNQASLINGPNGWSRSQVADFYPAIWENGRVPQVATGNAADYRVPFSAKVEELFYNTAMFKRAGITGCPATWTALGADLVKLKVPGVVPMGFKDASAHIESAFISNGGSLIAPGSNGRATAYDTKAGTRTFSQFRQWYSQKLFVFDHGADMRAAIASKKMAIEDGTSAGWVKVRTEAAANGVTVGACPYPAGTSGHPGNIVQGLAFAIFTHDTSAQQEAALDFEQYWDSPKVQALWSVGSGFAPTVRSATPLIPSSYLDGPAGQGLKASIGILASPYTQPRGQSDAYAEVDQAVDSAFFKAVTGAQPVTAALAHLDKVDAGYLSDKAQI